MKDAYTAAKLAATAREHSPLTAMQAELLRRVGRALPFCADILGAQLTLYLPALEKGRFFIAASLLPQTAAFPNAAEFPRAGTSVACAEEPLVRAALQKGGLQRGRREIGFGESLEMFAFAVADGAAAVAAVALVIDSEGRTETALAHLIETAQDVVRQAKKAQTEGFFPPLAPGTAILIADRFNRIVFANAAALHLYRVLGVGSLVGVQLFDRRLCAQITRESVRAGEPQEKELEAGGRTLLVRDVTLTEGGAQLRRIRLLQDVTELREKERELRVQSAVIQEIHHRVKNNLQTIASLLRMQARRSASDEVRAALQESVGRILAMAGAHEFLSKSAVQEVDVHATAKRVLAFLAAHMLPAGFSLNQEIQGAGLILPASRAANLALVMNEIFSNSLTHGFAGRERGRIGLRTSTAERCARLVFFDDGCGLPTDFSLEKSRTLGLAIVRTIVEGELGGIVRIKSGGKAEGAADDAAMAGLPPQGTQIALDIPWEGA